MFKPAAFAPPIRGHGRTLRTLALLLALGACTSIAPGPATVTVSLIGMNDFHGNLLPTGGSVTIADPNHPAGVKVPAGGAAYLATLVTQLKARNPGNTLVVGAGDLIGASPLESSLFHEEVTIEVLNQIGLDISAVGNHEFDQGRDELLRLQNGGCFPAAAGKGVVGVDTCMSEGRFGGAKFQYLAANVFDARTGATLLPATAIRRVGGLDIGFIGLTTRATPSVTTPAAVQGLRFDDEVQTINGLVPSLKQAGVAAIVVLIHEGGSTKATAINDKTCPGLSGEIVGIADRLDPAVEVIISGHSHSEYVCTRPDGKIVTQTGSYGRVLSHINLVIDPRTKRVVRKEANNVPVVNEVILKDARGQPLALPANIAALKKDAAVEALVQRAVALTAPLTGARVGMLSGRLDRAASDAGESTIGNVAADAYLAATSGPAWSAKPAQIAFTNQGGLRNDLAGNGPVTFGQLYSVMPFNNSLVSMDLTGAQLLRLLEQQWEQPQPSHGNVLSGSANFTYAWDAAKPAGATPGTGQRVVPGSMRLNGAPVEMAQVYRITVNSFMADGGDNFAILRSGANRQSSGVDLDALSGYFKAAGTLTPPPLGRVRRIN